MGLFRNHFKTAIVGFPASGKSALLAALYAQYKCNRGEFESVEIAASNYPATPALGEKEGELYNLPETNFSRLHNLAFGKIYATIQARDEVEGEWPEKTYSLDAGTLKVKHKNRWFADYHTFLDIPGEMLADISMYKTTYEDWSKEFLELHRRGHAKEIEEYETAARRATMKGEILKAFKVLLAKLVRCREPLIAPSRFILSRMPQKVTVEEISQVISEELDRLKKDQNDGALTGRPTGRMSGQEFAPFVDQCAVGQGVWRIFGDEYDKYVANRETMFEQLRACSTILILVDIAEVLNNGEHARVSTAKALSALLAQKPTLARKISGLLHRFGGQRRQIGLVATKFDTFRSALSGHVTDLAMDLLGQNEAMPIRPTVFNVAAVKCALDAEKKHFEGSAEPSPCDNCMLNFRVGYTGLSRAKPVAVESAKLLPSWDATYQWLKEARTSTDPCPNKGCVSRRVPRFPNDVFIPPPGDDYSGFPAPDANFRSLFQFTRHEYNR